MQTEELKNKFDDAVKEVYSKERSIGMYDFLKHVYTSMFGEYPSIIDLGNDGYYLNPDVDNDSDDIEEDDEYTEEIKEDTVYNFKSIFIQSTLLKIIDHFKDTAYVVRNEEFPIIIIDKIIVFYNAEDRNIYVLQNKEQLDDEIKECVVDRETVKTDDNVFFSYITNSGQGFNETLLKIKRFDTSVQDNYNDDLPDTEIKEFLKSTQSGLLLLHGIPGSGKTTYIRHLIRTLSGRHFIVLDSSTFNYITDASFIELLIENRNSVIILEDCESMLADRLVGNAQLASLLNLSDGIIGDSFNFKFICTFNANVAKIDKAILRRGRMRFKYEFKELNAEKTQKLAKKLGKEIPEGLSLTLADIYNYGVENGNKEEKRIGFK